jgi:hypothetical protein
MIAQHEAPQAGIVHIKGAENWREPMPVFKRELAFTTDRPSENAGHWWHLVFDTDAPGLYVEHTWIKEGVHAGNQAENGAERFGINDFLTLAEGQAAQPMLIAALKEMFRDTSATFA